MAYTPETTYPRLVGDIGGTNARFAWLESAGSPLSDVDTLAVASYPALIDAMRHYLATHGKPAPRQCAIGIANPVTGDHVQMTNHDWSFSISGVRDQLGLDRFLVINDFTALALALPTLAAQDLRQVGGGSPVPDAAIGLLGPGTGLGVSGLLPGPGGRGVVAVNGEGGHVTLAPTDALEDAVVSALRQRFGHASAERALSGPGLVNLYDAVCGVHGVAAVPLQPGEVSQRALQATDAQCVQALQLFCSFLGNAAGNLALLLGARGGVYVGGGIAPQLGRWLDGSPFRERFEGKGRFRPYLQTIPTFVLQAHVSPALAGAARALDQL